MAISELTSQRATATNGAATCTANYPATPTAGNGLICSVATQAASGVTSIPGWTQIAESYSGTAGNGACLVFVRQAGASESTGVTVTSTSSSVIRMELFEFSGLDVSSTRALSMANSGAVSVVSLAAGASAQTPVVGDLIFTAVSAKSVNANTWTVDSGLSVLQGVSRLASSGLVATAATAVNPTTGWSNASTPSQGVLAIFKPSVPGTVTGVAATSSALAVPPAVTGAANVTAVRALQTGLAVPPGVTAGANVTSVVAVATSAAVAPTVVGGAGAFAVAATAVAVAHPPTVRRTHSSGRIDGHAVFTSGKALPSHVFITPSAKVKDAAGNTVISDDTVRYDIDPITGYWLTDPLPATDDTALEPSGVTYKIAIKGLGNTRGVPVYAGQTVHHGDVAPVDPALDYAVEVSRPEFDALSARTLALEEHGAGGGASLTPDPAHPLLYIIGG